MLFYHFSCLHIVKYDLHNIVGRKLSYRDIAICITELGNPADEKSHQCINCIGGNHRCSSCLGNAETWSTRAYDGLEATFHDASIFVNLYISKSLL